MKSNIFFKVYFIIYLILFFFLVLSVQIRLDEVSDSILDTICFLLLPVVSLILSGIFSSLLSKLNKQKDTDQTDDIKKVNKKRFELTFFLGSFFILSVYIYILFILIELLDVVSNSTPIYIVSLMMIASYLIVVLASSLFSRFVYKLDNKVYLIVYPLVLLILSFVLSVYSKIDNESDFTYRVNNFLALILPVVVVILSFVISSLLLARKNEDEETHQLNGSNKLVRFNKCFFIASLITTFFNICVCFSVLNRFNLDTEELVILLVYFFFTSICFSILTAFAIQVVVHYWKKTKITSILFSIVYIQVLAGLFYWSYSVLETKLRNSHYIEYDTNSEVIVEEVETSSADEHEDEVDEVEKEKPFYLNFLWEKSNADTQNITNALQEVRNSYNYDVLLSNIPYLKESDNTRPIYKIVQYISQNRTKIDFSNLLNTYSNLITTAIPKSVYEKNQYDMMLGLLSDSYYDLSDYDENKEMYKMKDIYEIMYTSGGDYKDKFELIKPYISTYYRKKYDYFGTDFDNFSDYQQLVWAYSFWGRRYNEGNIQKTIELLHNIRSLYNDYDDEY